MAYQFSKHYTRDEARVLLPRLRQWLQQLNQSRRQYAEFQSEINTLLTAGEDAGGDAVNLSLKALVQMRKILSEFKQREIQIKDVDRGLIDFPSLMGGREVFLCWEMDEEDIEFWHDLETGYSGREKI